MGEANKGTEQIAMALEKKAGTAKQQALLGWGIALIVTGVVLIPIVRISINDSERRWQAYTSPDTVFQQILAEVQQVRWSVDDAAAARVDVVLVLLGVGLLGLRELRLVRDRCDASVAELARQAEFLAEQNALIRPRPRASPGPDSPRPG